MLSDILTKTIDKATKKNEGIYFTPKEIVTQNMELLSPFLSNVKTVLEPSCGSGEYIEAINTYCRNIQIIGIETNKQIYDTIKLPLQSLMNPENEMELFHVDYLKCGVSSFDLIIGNPPYFVMKKCDVSKEYYPYFDGRPNIFILFIIKSLQLLNDDGILSYILPTSFLNCLYYNKIRQYIITHCTILSIVQCAVDFLDTKQETIIFIVKRKVDTTHCNDTYFFAVNGYIIFGTQENIKQIISLYGHSTTLSMLNCVVNVGNVVWNQVKSLLTNDSTKTRLIYSSDISDGKFLPKVYSNNEKKNYINKSGHREPILLINRGYGMGNYKFEYCLMDEDIEYLVENHLICIKPKHPLPRDDLIALYNQIVQSLTNEKTEEFIQLYFGNNAINTTELSEILPIYLHP